MENERTVRDLGTLTGPVLVFGGIYSNLPALEKLRELAQSWGIGRENIICTGDVVGYCGDPDAVARMMEQWGVSTIAGNVEIQMREGLDECGCSFAEGSRCDALSQEWYPFAQLNTSPEALAWMGTLPAHLRFRYAGREVLVVHGSWHETAEYVFASTPDTVLQRNFTDAGAEVILAGHCGLPFARELNGRHWLNAGVIGMPANDGTTRVWCLLLDDAGGFSGKYRSFTYDHFRAAARMRTQGLPEAYALTLETGIWDNMDILPEAERQLQGQAITLDPMSVSP
ncbi:MAG: metallophosphoesterase family protein [Bacteroidota bacterium]